MKRSAKRPNPVATLGRERQWFRELPRQNVIKAHRLPTWFKAAQNLDNDKTRQGRETIRDVFLLYRLPGAADPKG